MIKPRILHILFTVVLACISGHASSVDLTGQWEGTSTCTCYENSIAKQFETTKIRGDVFMSINTNGIGETYARSNLFGPNATIHIGESFIKPGTGEGALMDCSYNVGAGLGGMALIEFDVSHGAKDRIDVTRLISGATDTVLLCKCSDHLERVSVIPNDLVDSCTWPL